MADLDEIREIVERLKDRYNGAGIQHIPKEDVESRQQEMLDVLVKKWKLLDKKKADFKEIGRSLSEEGTAEAKKLLGQLEGDIEKVDLEINRVKGYLLTFGKREEITEKFITKTLKKRLSKRQFDRLTPEIMGLVTQFCISTESSADFSYDDIITLLKSGGEYKLIRAGGDDYSCLNDPGIRGLLIGVTFPSTERNGLNEVSNIAEKAVELLDEDAEVLWVGEVKDVPKREVRFLVVR